MRVQGMVERFSMRRMRHWRSRGILLVGPYCLDVRASQQGEPAAGSGTCSRSGPPGLPNIDAADRDMASRAATGARAETRHSAGSMSCRRLWREDGSRNLLCNVTYRVTLGRETRKVGQNPAVLGHVLERDAMQYRD